MLRVTGGDLISPTKGGALILKGRSLVVLTRVG